MLLNDSIIRGGISMSNAIQVHSPGGPEVLKWEAVEVGDPPLEHHVQLAGPLKRLAGLVEQGA